MKKFFEIIAAICLSGAAASAQTPKILTLEECYRLAKENYPLVKQRSLIEKTSDYNIENIAHGLLPQFNFTGQATYQSAVTKILVKIPGMDIPELNKDQYKAYGEVSQLLYDGGITRQQKLLQEANRKVEEQKLEVQFYTLKERINQLFFGILMADERLRQNELFKNDILVGLKKAGAAIANGIALKSTGNSLQAELLVADQHTIEIKANKLAYLQMLGLFLNKQLDENTKLAEPPGRAILQENRRPELVLYNYQQNILDLRHGIINAKNRPRINLFLQGGLGRPALNFLSNDAEGYYIGGIKFQWSLSGLYNSKNEKLLIGVDKKSIDVQKETFLFNTNVALRQETEEINKIKELLETDNKIIELRSSIKIASLAQLENGVITASDYIREANAEDMARQNRIMHETQLLYAEYNHLATSGN